MAEPMMPRRILLALLLGGTIRLMISRLPLDQTHI